MAERKKSLALLGAESCDVLQALEETDKAAQCAALAGAEGRNDNRKAIDALGLSVREREKPQPLALRVRRLSFTTKMQRAEKRVEADNARLAREKEEKNARRRGSAPPATRRRVRRPSFSFAWERDRSPE